MTNYDTIIIGAGAAGLACADKLLDAGLKIMVLEARARVGGRAHTLTHLSDSVELGAEFIHGADAAFVKEFEKAGLPFIDVGEKRFRSSGGKLVLEEDFWEEIKDISAHLNPKLKRDRSMEEFLKVHGSKLKPKIRGLYRSYLEGFHAADLGFLSEKALAQLEQDTADDINGTEMFRPLGGYKKLMDYWLKKHGDARSWLQLEAPVQKISWKKRSVTVHGQPFSQLKAKSVVITVPLGVLKSEHPLFTFEIDPLPPSVKEALTTMHMGHVERLTFEFTERFWEHLTKEPIGFIMGPPESYFSTWWTQWPKHSPFIVAWQGGPKAFEIGHWPVEKQVDVALKSLAKLVGHSERKLKGWMKSYHVHNWASDPYSQGAYSYMGVGASQFAPALRKPIEQTLIFAGEATAEKNQLATIHGAMHSGWRAAKQVLALASH